jgi:oligoribonuclease
VLGIFLDTETNGLNAQKHKILELAYKILDVSTGEIKEEFQSIILQPLDVWQKSDPESLKITGFTWEEISHGKLIPDVAEKVKESFARQGIKRGLSVFICQNPSFDRAFFSQLIDADAQEALLWPYHWLDLASMYWAEGMRKGRINPSQYPWETGFSKDKIAHIHNLPSEGKPHRAMNGVNHLLLCYEAVIGFPLKRPEPL